MRGSSICVAMAIGFNFIAGCGGDQSTSANPATTSTASQHNGLSLSGAQMHAKHLYVGVSCSKGNEIGCDGIALSVEVPDEPDFVEADVDGYRARLERVAAGKNVAAYYQGRIQRPGLLHEGPLEVDPEPNGKWIGVKAVYFPMSLRAIYRDEGIYSEQSFNRVRLNPGFG